MGVFNLKLNDELSLKIEKLAKKNKISRTKFLENIINILLMENNFYEDLFLENQEIIKKISTVLLKTQISIEKNNEFLEFIIKKEIEKEIEKED